MALGEEIGALFVKIGADMSELSAGLGPGGKADKELEGFTGRANAAIAKVGAVLVGLGATIVTGLYAAYQKTEDMGQAAYDMGEKFGLSGGEASRWIAIAAQLGITSESVGTGFKFLSKNVETMNLAMKTNASVAELTLRANERVAIAQDRYNAAVKAHGVNSLQARTALLALQQAQDMAAVAIEKAVKVLGPAALAFKELGINVFDAKGNLKSVNDLMIESADSFAKMKDGPEKAGLAMKLFGRSGADLIPLLNQGSAGLRAMADQGVKLGTVMSTQQVDAAHKAYLAHEQFNQALSGLTNQIGIKLMPAATSLFGYFVNTAIPAIERFTGWVQTLNPELKKAYDIFSTLAPYILGVGAAWVIWNVALAVTEAIQMASMSIQFVLGLIQIVRSVGLATAAQWLWNIAMDANPIGLVIIAIGLLVAGVIYAYTHFKWFRDFVNVAWEVLKRFGAWLSEHLAPIIKGIGDAISAIGSGLQWLGNAAHGAHIPGFAMGGTVPGPTGMARFAIVHGGERVLTPQQQAQGGGNSNVTVTLTPARLNNPADLLDALYALMSAAETRRARGAQGFLGSV